MPCHVVSRGWYHRNPRFSAQPLVSVRDICSKALDHSRVLTLATDSPRQWRASSGVHAQSFQPCGGSLAHLLWAGFRRWTVSRMGAVESSRALSFNKPQQLLFLCLDRAPRNPRRGRHGRSSASDLSSAQPCARSVIHRLLAPDREWSRPFVAGF